MSRRALMQSVAAGTAVAGTAHLSPWSPARAFDFRKAADNTIKAPIRGSVWVVNQLTGNGSTKSAEEASQEAEQSTQHQILHQAADTRAETTARTVLESDSFFGDEGLNTIGGLKQMAIEEGQKAANDAINNGKSESEVTNAAHSRAGDVFAPLQSTLIKEWNTAVQELASFINEIGPKTAYDNDIAVTKDDTTDATWPTASVTPAPATADGVSDSDKLTTVTLADGSSKDVLSLIRTFGTDDPSPSSSDIWDQWSPVTTSKDSPLSAKIFPPSSSESKVLYLDNPEWTKLWNKLETEYDNVESELTTWVSNTYSEVQSGDISTEELYTSLDVAKDSVEGEDTPRAVTDLIALNVPVELDRKVAVEYQDDEGRPITWTYSGFFSATKSPSNGFDAGTTYTPNSTDPTVGSVYLAAHTSDIRGKWTDYKQAVDGGIVTLNQEPIKNYTYRITTADDETATLGYGDFAANGSGGWEGDISEQVENPITEVAQIDMFVPEGVDEYVTVHFKQDFKIVEIIDETSGETFDNVEIDRPVPSDPTDYQTEEDFKQAAESRRQLYNDLEELFEEVEASGGSSGGNWWDNPFSFLSNIGNGVRNFTTMVVIGIAAIFGISLLN